MESVSSRCCVTGDVKESRKQTTIPGGPRAQQVRARLGPGSRCSLRRRWLRLEEPGQGRGEGRGWYWKGGRQGRGRKMATSGANGPGSASTSASASNPRKFSEKIALQKQRQAEETAAFEEVMMDIGSTRLQAQKLRLAYTRSSHYGGSLPNVNQIGSGLAEFQSPLHSPLDSSRSTRHHGLVERVQRDPRRMVSPLRRYPRHISFTGDLGVSEK